MEYINILHAQLTEDGFNFTPILDEAWHKIKEPIRGRYATRKFPNGVVMTIMSWDESFKKTYKAFVDNHINGEAGEIENFIKEQIEETRKQKAEANERAALEAQKEWDSAISEPIHENPYLKNKALGEGKTLFGARVDALTGCTLIIPCRDINGKLWGLQRIFASGDKRFIKGQRKEGTFHLIGEVDPTGILYIAEGFATGASVYLATTRPTAIAWDAGGISRVARLFREKYPKLKILIAGDNDTEDKKCVGQKAAEKAAKEVGGHFIIPNSGGVDWNDCLVDAGLEYMRKRFADFEIEAKSKEKFIDDYEVRVASERRGLVSLEPDWLVDQLFARSSSSLLSADPKAGKSTLTRYLTSCLADGKEFLGFKCKPSKILMIAVEEKERFLLRDFEKLNIKNWHNILYHTATTPSKALEKAENCIIKYAPDFVIFDTMFKILQPEDENSYAQTTTVISKIQNLVDWHRVHILSVHHNNKGNGSGFGKILGSNGIRGAFDYNIVIDCDAKEIENNAATASRYIMSEGREGHFFKKTALTFDCVNKTFALGESFEAHQKKKSEEQTYAGLCQIKGAMTKAQWYEVMKGVGQKQERIVFFEKLVEEGMFIEEGKKWKWNKGKINEADKF